MTQCDIHVPWLDQVAVSEFGTVMDAHGSFGLGAVLIAERSDTQEVLLVRKSARPGFKGNDQLAFPGGIVRPHGTHTDVSERIRRSLAEHVAAEVNLKLTRCSPMAMLAVTPPHRVGRSMWQGSIFKMKRDSSTRMVKNNFR